MDSTSLSKIFGYTALGLVVVGQLAQSLKPDAKRIRRIKIPTTLAAGVSYYAMNRPIATAHQVLAALRSSIRSTKWGARSPNKELVAAFSMVALGLLTWQRYKSPQDALPFMSLTGAALADYSSQGRYQRLFIIPSAVISVTYAALQKNWALMYAFGASGCFNLSALYRHDIRGAAGKPDAGFAADFRAYRYGIRHNCATGASILGQVCTDPTDEEPHIQYASNLARHPNPHFTPLDNTPA